MQNANISITHMLIDAEAMWVGSAQIVIVTAAPIRPHPDLIDASITKKQGKARAALIAGGGKKAMPPKGLECIEEDPHPP